MKNMKRIHGFLAFSPKASKSRLVQAGLLTYPLFNAFPLRMFQNSGSLLKSYSGITAAGTVQESSVTRLTCFPFNPLMRNLFGHKVNQKNERIIFNSYRLLRKFIKCTNNQFKKQAYHWTTDN